MSPATAACAAPESVANSTAEQSTTRRDMKVPSGSTGLSTGTRTTGPLITHHGAVRDAWPHIARRLSAYLRRRGASWHDTDDIVQECAVRVLRHEVPFTDADDLLTWCLTVVRNAHVDLHRGQGRLTSEAVPDLPASIDVHDEVVARLRLRSVVTAWPQLSAADQLVLAEAVEQVPAPLVRREAVRLYVQRNRARQRLHGLIAALVGVLAVIGRSARRQVLPLTTLTAAAVTFLALAPGPSQSPPLQLVPDRHANQSPVGGAQARPFQPNLLAAARKSIAAAARQPSAVHPIRSAPRPSMRVVASAQGPGGYGAQVASHDRPTSGGGLACVGDLPLLPDTCVPDPSPSLESVAG